VAVMIAFGVTFAFALGNIAGTRFLVLQAPGVGGQGPLYVALAAGLASAVMDVFCIPLCVLLLLRTDLHIAIKGWYAVCCGALALHIFVITAFNWLGPFYLK